MFFSWLAKLLYIIMDISSLEQLFPNISGYYFYKLIFKYRLAFSFIGIGAYLNYIFEIKVFKKKADKKYLLAFKIYVVFFFLFNIIFIPAENEFLDIISFGLMFILMLVVYLPFIYRNLRLSRRIEQGAYKNGLISLGVMGIFFILISVNMLADRAMIIFFDSSGYTFFYYAGWSSTIFAVLSAYYGFIRPAAYKKKWNSHLEAFFIFQNFRLSTSFFLFQFLWLFDYKWVLKKSLILSSFYPMKGERSVSVRMGITI